MLKKNSDLLELFKAALGSMVAELRDEFGEDESEEEILEEALGYICPPKEREINKTDLSRFLFLLGGEQNVSREFIDLITDFDFNDARNKVANFASYNSNPANGITEPYLSSVIETTLEMRKEGIPENILVIGFGLIDEDFLIIRKESSQFIETVGFLNHENFSCNFIWPSFFDFIISGFDD